MLFVAFCFDAGRVGSRSLITAWARAAVRRAPAFGTAVVAFGVAMTPFLITYLPILKQNGGREFWEVLGNTAQPIDLLNVGEGNRMWGHSLDALRVWLGYGQMIVGEPQRGWPPFTLVLIAFALFLSVRGRSRTAARVWEERKQTLPVFVVAVSFFICWALSVKAGAHSLWWLIYKFVPGGSAIRVPARINNVLNILVVIVVCQLLDRWKNHLKHLRGSVFWLIPGILIAEQINIGSDNIVFRRDSERAILDRVQRPPSACTAFFFTRLATPERQWFANHIDAMMIARLNNIPTLNGYSGWLPPGWGLGLFDANYRENVKRWAESRHITKGLCGLNMRSGTWSFSDPKSRSYPLTYPIDFHLGGDAYLYETEGWGQAEDGGSWALGRHSALRLQLSTAPTSDLLLKITAHGFTPPQHSAFRETVLVNDTKVAEWAVTSEQSQLTKEVILKRAILDEGSLKIEFFNDDPRSPAELGWSTDTRKISLALESLSLQQLR